MTPDDVRAAAAQLVDFHERFAPLFGKEQAQDHAHDYLKGLMVCPERKSVEPIALPVGHGDASGLQKFVGAGPWPYDDGQAEAQALFADELVPSAVGSPVGVVGVVDESAFTKKATVFGVKARGPVRWRSGGEPHRVIANSGSQRRPVRMTALAITSSFRATAVRITFAFLPRDASRSRNALRAGLYRTADSAAR